MPRQNGNYRKLTKNGTKKKDIAKAINVSPSTISREIKRNESAFMKRFRKFALAG
ncbi:MAG: helix-turn-helix domain-containing protein [Prevotella sp.]|nr:helix-turn-helix domain-containing protein [Prevotella sp.]